MGTADIEGRGTLGRVPAHALEIGDHSFLEKLTMAGAPAQIGNVPRIRDGETNAIARLAFLVISNALRNWPVPDPVIDDVLIEVMAARLGYTTETEHREELDYISREISSAVKRRRAAHGP